MMKKNSKVSLISGIVFFVLGIIIFLNPEILVKTISYGLGGLLILIGIYKTVNYYIQDKRLGVVNRNEIAFGITAIILGVVFIFLADAIELLLRFVVGGWLVIAGLNKIFSTFYTRDRNSKFYSLLVVGIILICIGLYIILVSNLALSIIGLFMMLYGITDFISYFVYKNNTVNSDLDNLLNSNIDKEEVKDKNNKDEVIVETEFIEKKSKKSKKDKKDVKND